MNLEYLNQTAGDKNSKPVCIVGAGLVGSLLSIYLAKKGINVEVYEKRGDPRIDLKQRGRSIVMSISDRGWKALRHVGLEEQIKKTTVPKYNRMVHLDDGSIQVQSYGNGSQAIHTISRRFLNITLIEEAEKTGKVKFFFNHRCIDINPELLQVKFNHLNKNGEVERDFSKIIGADGIFSQVRQILVEKELWNFNKNVLEYGYKELSIPALENGEWALPNKNVHVWPRKNVVLIALPNQDGSFTCTLFLSHNGALSFEGIESNDDLAQFFKTQLKECIPLMPDLQGEFFRNPTSNIVAVKGDMWNYENKVLLIGDACHAIAPFFAKGMNAGFEDCTVFNELMEEYNTDLDRVFLEFSNRRKPDADAIGDLSIKNFNNIERSIDPNYHIKWLMERKISEMFPDSWIPSYAMIAFTHIPLSKVVNIKELQDEILDQLVKDGFDESSVSKETVAPLIEKLSIENEELYSTFRNVQSIEID